MRPAGTPGIDSVEAPAGTLDLTSATRLSELLAAAHRPGATVVLDLRSVTALDSSALGVVLAAERRLAADGGALRLGNARRPVVRVLRICGLAGLLLPPVAAAVEAAVG